MLTLYHNHTSTCSQKARLGLAEKGLEWVSRHLDLRAGDQQEPSYLKLNPKGVVPTLIHDEHVVRESNVILEYLDDAFPYPKLRPADPHGKAQMRLWLKRFDEGHHDIATATLSMGIAFRYQYLEQGEEKCRALIENVPDPIKRERRGDVIYNGTRAREFYTAVGMWIQLFDDMEVALGKHDWLAGDEYSIADAAYTPYLTRLEHLSVLPGFLNGKRLVQDWYIRVKERPSYKTAVKDWEDTGYLTLMAEKGEEARGRVEELINSFSKTNVASKAQGEPEVDPSG